MDSTPEPFAFLSQYFWLICLAFGGVNYVMARRKIARTIASDDPRRTAAQRYLVRFSVAGTVPWLVMGWAQLTGAVPTIWYYFRPQDRNPFVLAWLGSLFALAVVYAYWVLLCGGALKVKEFQLLGAFGFRNADRLSERLIKIIAVIGPLWVLLWVYLAASTDARIPR